jgi:hypothetical protein
MTIYEDSCFISIKLESALCSVKHTDILIPIAEEKYELP